ncbi:hypothetical protein QKT49_gp355 [Acanthamoeba castellanii medusavirus]|uniref:Protein kinase domain-containing protein n=1 Tax=Acanthamoeba castellanii medusavirus J1 TaxID=3114988 RepID=A0A3T1CX61_9VIRU|nr:hypothetical protein QKT49_gp355 [Acanthamoeba castellanii medusavirus]BBI30408.1 hypothetical protein [Acanthamoeba castellanii medusavirus J1]
MPRRPVPATPTGHSDKTVAELRAVAKSRGNVPGYSRMRKAQLIAMLKQTAAGSVAAKTVAQLRKEARLRKIPGYSRMRKADLALALGVAEPEAFMPCLMTEKDVNDIKKFFKTHPGVGRFDPINPCRALQSLFPATSPCVKGWTFEAILGVGRYGLTVGVRSGEKHAAFKVVTTRHGLDFDEEDDDAQDINSQDPVQEARVQEAFAKAGIAPKILSTCAEYSPKIRGRKRHECPEYAMIVMDRIRGVVNSLMYHLAIGGDYKRMLEITQDVWRQCREILTEMIKLGYTHGDMNLNNITVNGDEDNDFGPYGFQVLLIDYGLATTKFACPAVDVSWFVRNMCSPFHVYVAKTELGDWNADYERLYREFLLPASIHLFEWGIKATEGELTRSGSKLPKALGRKGIAALRQLIGLYRKYPWSTADDSTINKIQKKLAQDYIREMK